jgi:hypothetical protein
MAQEIDYQKIKYKDYILFLNTTTLPCPYPRDGDVLGVCILRNEKDKYKRRTDKYAYVHQVKSHLVLLKEIDNTLFVFEINKQNKTIKPCKRYRTLTEIFNYKFYGIIYNENIHDTHPSSYEAYYKMIKETDILKTNKRS